MKQVFLLLLSIPFCILSLAAQGEPDDRDKAQQAKTFRMVKEMPRFYSPSCESKPAEERRSCSNKAMLMAAYGNIKYPKKAKAQGLEGLAVVQFVVEKDGSISEVKLTQDPGHGMGEEALRVVKKHLSSHWVPGKDSKGKAVRVKFNLPLRFRTN